MRISIIVRANIFCYSYCSVLAFSGPQSALPMIGIQKVVPERAPISLFHKTARCAPLFVSEQNVNFRDVGSLQLVRPFPKRIVFESLPLKTFSEDRWGSSEHKSVDKIHFVLDRPAFAPFPYSRKQAGIYWIAGARPDFESRDVNVHFEQVHSRTDFPFTAHAVNIGIGGSLHLQSNRYFAEVAVLRMVVHDVLLGTSITHVHGVRVSFGISF